MLLKDGNGISYERKPTLNELTKQVSELATIIKGFDDVMKNTAKEIAKMQELLKPFNGQDKEEFEFEDEEPKKKVGRPKQS